MGRELHHAIVVTSWNGELLAEAREVAARLGCATSEIVPSGINNVASFFIAPDGSRDAWVESVEGDARRVAFLAWCNANRYDDGSSALCWVEVIFGEFADDYSIGNHDKAP